MTSPRGNASLLEVDGLTVRLAVEGEQRAVLRDVSLSVRPGEAVGLVGESGSGKSMTARAIDRLLPRGAEVSGQISFGGSDVMSLAGHGLRAYRNQVAMIFQDPRAHVNPVRRIGDFMTEALRTNLGVTGADARRRAAEMLGQVGIADGERRLRQYPHELSGGMLQRVMIAAALLTEPKLLLADEPTTALDVTTQAEVMAILDDLRREFGLAMLFITHDLELAAAICDRTAVMYAGQIVEVRESALLHSDPLHPYTAALSAARPDIAATARRLAAIPGRPLSAFEAPAQECAFAPRCPHAQEICRDGTPDLASLDGGLSRCVRAAELRGRLTPPVVSAPPSRPGPRRARWPVADVIAAGPAGGAATSSAGGEPVLAVTGLRKEFGDLVAVDDVSFEVPPARSLAIVGESGSGKTTIARMIVGLERATAGTISACGRDRSSPARSARDRRRRGGEVQIVFQDPYTSLDPRQTAEATIDEVLRLHHGWAADRRRTRIAELTGLVGLDERQARALPRALSGGQRQRVAIARALAAEPRVLILDESVAALDVSIQAQVLNLLADIRDSTSVSYVLISHDLAVVRQLTDDVIVLHRGVVVERGLTADVLDRPQHDYTRRLRASVPRPGWKPRRGMLRGDGDGDGDGGTGNGTGNGNGNGEGPGTP